MSIDLSKPVTPYVRVSTAGQVDGEGLSVQRDAIANWAKAHNRSLSDECADEGVTGSLLERDGLADALELVQSGLSAGIVVLKLDRLARDLIVQEQLMAEIWRAGGEIYSTSPDENNLHDDPEDPTRKLIRRVMGAVAEYERELIVLRMKRGRRSKARKRGFAYGSPPFGYVSHDAELVPYEPEQAVVRRIAALRGDGLSVRQIAAEINSAGLRTKRGNAWSGAGVSDVLTRLRMENANAQNAR